MIGQAQLEHDLAKPEIRIPSSSRAPAKLEDNTSSRQSCALQLNNIHLYYFVDDFNTRLLCVLDKHALLRTKLVAQRPQCPWFNDDVYAAKRERRRLEILLEKHNSIEYRAQFQKAKNVINELTDIAKKEHFQIEIRKNGNNQKALFKTFDRLTGKTKSVQYPKGDSDKDLTDNFFKDKIDKIGKSFNDIDIPTDCDTERILNVHLMTQLTALSEDQVSKYILKSPSTTQ